jgi:hypothetical protein
MADIIIPSNPKDLKDIKSEVQDCVDALTRASAEQEFVRETIKALAEKYEIKAKYVGKLVRTAYKLNLDAQKDETEALDELYTAVMEAK